MPGHGNDYERTALGILRHFASTVREYFGISSIMRAPVEVLPSPEYTMLRGSENSSHSIVSWSAIAYSSLGL